VAAPLLAPQAARATVLDVNCFGYHSVAGRHAALGIMPALDGEMRGVGRFLGCSIRGLPHRRPLIIHLWNRCY